MVTAESGVKYVSKFSRSTHVCSEPGRINLLNSYMKWLARRYGLLVLRIILQSGPNGIAMFIAIVGHAHPNFIV